VDLDGDGLHRAAFLRGVALAARIDPAEDAPELARAIAIAPLVPPEPERPSGMGPLILVAEDNAVNQQVLTKQLALLGYRAEMVGDGVEALARWRCGGHALLLTDLHMPNMDGYMLAAAVRAEEGQASRLPIIALTANALRDEEYRCHQAGMDAYLTKPVRLAHLKTAIDAWLRPAPAKSSVTGMEEAVPSASSPVDLGILADLLGDDPQVMQEVLAAFRTNTAGSSLVMAKAHSEGVAQTMFDVAHKLKSTARAIGAARLGQICADIEEVAASKAHTPALEPLVAHFEAEMLAVHSFLDNR
jgi:CheY-like chemotaxis protein/HPt (histidine-containing phosphotransfer) domain-containing protein